MKFHLGDILSVTTGVALVDNAMQRMGKLCVYMISGPNDKETLEGLPHAFLQASGVCKRELIKQHPWLANIKAEAMKSDQVDAWLAKQTAIYGKMHEVETIGMAALYSNQEASNG